MRISRNSMIISMIYLFLSISTLYFMTESGDIPLSKIIISFPIEIATSPLNIGTVMLLIFWVTPEFVVIAYCFHYFTKYQQKIAIYVLTRSKSVVRNLKFILIRIASLVFLVKSTKFLVVSIFGNIGIEAMTSQIGPYILSMLIPIIALELICIAYFIRRDERLIIIYIVLHLSGMLALIQFKQKFVNLLFYSIKLNDLFPTITISIVLIVGLFYTMAYLAGKVEY